MADGLCLKYVLKWVNRVEIWWILSGSTKGFAEKSRPVIYTMRVKTIAGRNI